MLRAQSIFLQWAVNSALKTKCAVKCHWHFTVEKLEKKQSNFARIGASLAKNYYTKTFCWHKIWPKISTPRNFSQRLKLKLKLLTMNGRNAVIGCNGLHKMQNEKSGSEFLMATFTSCLVWQDFDFWFFSQLKKQIRRFLRLILYLNRRRHCFKAVRLVEWSLVAL